IRLGHKHASPSCPLGDFPLDTSELIQLVTPNEQSYAECNGGKLHYAAPPQRNTAPVARRLGFPERQTMLLRAIYAHYGRQNRSFEGNATQREKQQDWMAEDAVSGELFSARNSL